MVHSILPIPKRPIMWPKHKAETTLHEIIKDGIVRDFNDQQIVDETKGIATTDQIAFYRNAMELMATGGMKHHGQWIVEYPGEVFVVFDPMSDGCYILGAFRRLEDAQYHLKDMTR